MPARVDAALGVTEHLAARQLDSCSVIGATNADQRTVTSTHGGLLDDPQASLSSVTAIVDVVDAVRTGSRLTA